MLINTNITVWDSYTTETHNVVSRIDHQSGLVGLAKTSTICPLVLSREIHADYCEHSGENPEDMELLSHGQLIGDNLKSGLVLVSMWRVKNTGITTTYTSALRSFD